MEIPEMMPMDEFCSRYRIGRTTAYREIAAGRLKVRKLGSATRVVRADAEAWLAGLPVRKGGAV